MVPSSPISIPFFFILSFIRLLLKQFCFLPFVHFTIIFETTTTIKSQHEALITLFFFLTYLHFIYREVDYPYRKFKLLNPYNQRVITIAIGVLKIAKLSPVKSQSAQSCLWIQKVQNKHFLSGFKIFLKTRVLG